DQRLQDFNSAVSNKSNALAISYIIKNCEGGGPVDDVGFLFVKKEDGTLYIKQKENYVCCANITITMEVDNNSKIIRLYEENIGDYCRCICPFEAEIKIENYNDYPVEIYGIKYKNVYNYSLLQEWPNAKDCYRDSDCVNTPDCCHQSSNKCIAKKDIKEWPKCEGIPCTEECRPCISCSCIDNKCVSNFVGGCC
ncbi:MAG: hypothetical protein QXY64_03045, partial [Candidatus Bilamarchaeaceae archaeon]